mgnify:FL=1
MNAKEYLMQVKKLDRMIQNKSAELEMWHSIATGTGSKSDGERVQSSSSQQKMEDAVVESVQVEWEISNLIERKSQIINTIEQLPTEEYDLLHRKYIQHFDLVAIAKTRGKSYSWATTVHGQALKHLQAILDARGEEE